MWHGDAEAVGDLDDGPRDAVKFERLTGLAVLEHRGLVVANLDSRFEAAVHGNAEARPESRGDVGALLHDRAEHRHHLGQRTELAEGGAGQRADRIEGRVTDQLEPDLIPETALDRAFEAAGDERLRDVVAALAHDAVGLADREPGSLDMPDHAGCDDLGRAVDDAADDPLDADRRADHTAGVDA